MNQGGQLDWGGKGNVDGGSVGESAGGASDHQMARQTWGGESNIHQWSEQCGMIPHGVSQVTPGEGTNQGGHTARGSKGNVDGGSVDESAGGADDHQKTCLTGGGQWIGAKQCRGGGWATVGG